MFELGTTYLTYAGYTIPFQDLLEADADPYISIDDIEPVLRNYYTYDGKMQCIPLNPSTPIMYYNKTIFKAAGLDPEAPPTTFAEIAAIADKLMATGGNLQAAMGLPIYGWFFENFLAGLEKCYVNNNNGRTGIATAIEYDTNGAGVKILETWKSMVDAGIIYNFGQVNADSRAAFIAGQTAITLESTAQLTTLTNSIAGAFELGTAYLPSMLDKSNGGVLIGGANLWVVKNEDSQRVADTWSFVKFATSAPVSAAFSMRTGYFCANTTAYNEPSFQEFLKERPNFLTAINQLHDTPVNYATQGAAVGVMAELRAIWQENMDLYLQGALTTEEALSNMAAASNEAITYYNTTVYGK